MITDREAQMAAALPPVERWGGRPRSLSAVQLYFDESGDFAFPIERFDAYTQAVVICPDSKMAVVENYVADRLATWGLAELHARDLDDDQLWDVCKFIRAQQLPALVQATDTTAVTLKDIETHRIAQAAQLQSNADEWRRAGGNSESIAKWYDTQILRSAHPGKLHNSEWVQADLLVDLIHQAINKGIVFFHRDEWRPDFETFRFVFDAKLSRKRARGEKHLDAVLLGFLASNPDRIAIIWVEEWSDPPVHPFHRNFLADGGGVDLRKLFEYGLEFESSHDRPGLQLADVSCIRRSTANPRNGERENPSVLASAEADSEDAGRLIHVPPPVRDGRQSCRFRSLRRRPD